MKSARILIVNLVGVIVAATGCQTWPSGLSRECPRCPTAPATIPTLPQNGPSAEEIGAAFGMHNNFRQNIECRVPPGPRHLDEGDRFAFGRYRDGWYLMPYRELINKGWAPVIRLEYRPGPPRSSFPIGCDLKEAYKKLKKEEPTEEHEAELNRLEQEAQPLDGFENWQGEIGTFMHSDTEGPMCHKIRLQFFNYSGPEPVLNGNNYFMEIEKCEHSFDAAAGVPQVQLWHGGIYHGTD